MNCSNCSGTMPDKNCNGSGYIYEEVPLEDALNELNVLVQTNVYDDH